MTGWLLGVLAGLLIAYILLEAFFFGVRRARRSLAALADQGYAPMAAGDSQIQEAVRKTLPVYAMELLTKSEEPSATPRFGMLRRGARRARFIMYMWRGYRHRPAQRGRANTQETLLLEVGATGIDREFEVSPFPPDRVRHGLPQVSRGLSDRLSNLLWIYSRDPEGVRVPEGLQEALVQVAPVLKEGLATKSSAGIPRQVVGVRFTPEGWALSCNPYLQAPSELAELLRVADTNQRRAAGNVVDPTRHALARLRLRPASL